MSDNITLLAAAAAVLIIKRRRRRRENRATRSVWSRQWLTERQTLKGMNQFVMNELQQDDSAGFKGFLRLTPDIFNELLERIEPKIRCNDTIMRDCISPQEMLVVTLRYLASGKLSNMVINSSFP